MRFKGIVGLAVIGFAAWTMLPAWAHHAHGNYTETVVDLEGKVTEFHKINPHPWIYIEVVRDGQKKLWALEGGGQREQNIKVGDTIKARCHPLRDGNPVCLLGFVKAADGTVKDWDGNQAPPKDF
jgi:hypothetical protein